MSDMGGMQSVWPFCHQRSPHSIRGHLTTLSLVSHGSVFGDSWRKWPAKSRDIRYDLWFIAFASYYFFSLKQKQQQKPSGSGMQSLYWALWGTFFVIKYTIFVVCNILASSKPWPEKHLNRLLQLPRLSHERITITTLDYVRHFCHSEGTYAQLCRICSSIIYLFLW